MPDSTQKLTNSLQVTPRCRWPPSLSFILFLVLCLLTRLLYFPFLYALPTSFVSFLPPSFTHQFLHSFFFKSCFIFTPLRFFLYVAASCRRGVGSWIQNLTSHFRRWLGRTAVSDDDSEEKVPEGKEQQPSRFEVGLH